MSVVACPPSPQQHPDQGGRGAAASAGAAGGRIGEAGTASDEHAPASLPLPPASLPPPPAVSSVLVTNNIKVANVSSVVTQDVLETLFGFLGEIRSVRLQPSPFSSETNECIVEYADTLAVQTALHLTGTELGDRTLVVTANYNPAAAVQKPLPGIQAAPILKYSHPAAAASHFAAVAAAQAAAATGGTGAPGVVAGFPQTAALAPPGTAVGVSPLAQAAGFYANAAAAAAAAAMAGFDPIRAEEISRTIYVGNITGYVSEAQLLELCSAIGPVAHIKLAGAVDANTRFAFVEFTHVDDARKALTLNGTVIADRPLKVSPSKSAINKPANLRKTADSADVVAAMQRVREAQQRIASKYGAAPAASIPSVAPGSVGSPATGPAPALPASSTTSAADGDEEQHASSYRSRRHGRSRSRSTSRSRKRYMSSSHRRRRSPSRDRDRSRDGYGKAYDYYKYSSRRSRSRSIDYDYRRGRSSYVSERDRDYDRKERNWGRRRGDDYYSRDERRDDDDRREKYDRHESHQIRSEGERRSSRADDENGDGRGSARQSDEPRTSASPSRGGRASSRSPSRRERRRSSRR